MDLRGEFIRKAKLVQDKEYDYSKVEYKDNKTKVCVICPKHGEFYIRPNDFLSKHFCPKCGIEKRKTSRSLTQDEFLERVSKVFPQYDYSNAEYKNSHTKVKVICPIHGEFESLPYHLMHGHGCLKCGQESTHSKQRKTVEEFICEAKECHGDKYDYSKVVYKNRGMKVCIICPKHGEFWQTPYAHTRLHQGCPKCSNSILEENISNFLSNNGIEFEQEKKFDWLGLQSLDFYLPKYNVGIECQGIQHFEPIEIFGGESGFNYRRNNDERKLRLCTENGVKLLYYSTFDYPNVFTNTDKLLKKIKNGF